MKCYDTELDEGAKNEVGVRVMYMFNLVKATQSEQRVEDQQWVISHTYFSAFKCFIICFNHNKIVSLSLQSPL